MSKIKPMVILWSLLSFSSCKKETQEIIVEKPKPKLAVLEYLTEAKLGEGAFWNHETQELYWVDIEGKKLHIYNPTTKVNRSLETPSRIGTVVPKDETHAVIALENGIYIMNTQDGSLEQLSNIESHKTENRFNDGKCDPMGRLWVGSMNLDAKTKSGALYMIGSAGTAVKQLDGVTISNGIVWTSDKKTMYYIDTALSTIKAYDYDLGTGGISNERVAVVVADSLGSPDGMAIDSNDELWVGLWGGSAVGHFDPLTGKLIERVYVPAQNVTSCAFGGKELDTLYITTASLYMSTENEARYKTAGSIFKYAPGVKGVKSNFFK